MYQHHHCYFVKFRNGAHLSLARYGSNLAHFAAFQCVNDATLSDVRISYEANRDLLPIRVQLRELAEELDERAFAEGVIRGGVEGEGRVAGGEVLDVACLS